MRHKNCDSLETAVVDTRPRVDFVHRRRECLKCRLRFNTREIAINEDQDRQQAKLLKQVREAANNAHSSLTRLVELNGKLRKDLNYMTQKKSELEMPIWAVVSAKKVEARRLTYQEACDEVDQLKSEKITDLFITTDDAAARMAERGVPKVASAS